jgi:AbrB family looped-hinge helix DNA binding protein
MQQTVRISSKRQITIPVKIYNKLNLRAGQQIIINADEYSLTMTPAEALIERLAGSVSVSEHLKGVKDLDKVIEQGKRNYFKKKYGKSVR